MWIDSHCHLDSAAFDADRDAVIARSRAQSVSRWIVPAVHPNGFKALQNLAAHTPGMVYTLGIHPCWVDFGDDAGFDAQLASLESHITAALADPRFIGIGEIGLDRYPTAANWQRQLEAFHAQLKLAKRFDLPVIIHSRQTNDQVAHALRQYPVRSGIVHAFSGSEQQADNLLQLNMALGFGGTTTFARANRIRRLISYLPGDAIVLETDSPDMAPAWLRKPGGEKARNEPGELARIANEILIVLQEKEPSLSLEVLAARQQANLLARFPRLSLSGAIPAS